MSQFIRFTAAWEGQTSEVPAPETKSQLGSEPDPHGNPPPFPDCYGCGSDNPIGLHLEMEFDGKELRSRFTPLDQHQGYPGIVHGGIISSLLYELMSNIQRYSGDEAVLRTSSVRFLRPVPVNEQIVVTARTIAETSYGWDVTAEIRSDSGNLLASSSGEAVRSKR